MDNKKFLVNEKKIKIKMILIYMRLRKKFLHSKKNKFLSLKMDKFKKITMILKKLSFKIVKFGVL
jgi:hypothetical protein